MRVRLVDTLGNSCYVDLPHGQASFDVCVIASLSSLWQPAAHTFTFRPLAFSDGSPCVDHTGTPIWGTRWGADTADGFLGALRPPGPQTLDTESFRWHRELDQFAAQAKLFPPIVQDGDTTYE